jgi:hypothetical protein
MATLNGYEKVLDERITGHQVHQGTMFPLNRQLVETNWVRGSCVPADTPVFLVRSTCNGTTQFRAQFKTLREARKYWAE